tara:strand:- start:6314 stop:6418 length:105 start_codon:yes stop_codon:yes gene_type:complete
VVIIEAEYFGVETLSSITDYIPAKANKLLFSSLK